MRAKLSIGFIVFLTVISSLLAQKEGNIWYFGYYAGIDFNVSPPKPLYNSALNTNEGCATICDKAGDLMFYTDGTTIWNKNHRVMVNGNGLLGHSSSTQSGVIVPRPGSKDFYYVFTVTDKYENYGFCYSIVDMSLDSGRGAVTIKNQQMHPTCAEKVTAVTHANGIDIWVIMKDWGNDEFRAYLITPNGLNGFDNEVKGYPVISKAGMVHQGDVYTKIGYLKASPDGKTLALANYGMGFSELFDFNNATGQITQKMLLSGSAYHFAYGVEFSPDGSKYYVSTCDNPSFLYQFDLTYDNIDTIIAKRHTLSEMEGENYAALQVASDGRIYLAIVNFPYLGVISEPNEAGSSCKYNYLGFNLGGAKSQYGLPTFIQTFFFNFSGKNIDMGSIPAETVKDSLITKFLENTGKFPITVKSMALKDGDADQFELLTQSAEFTLDSGEYKDIQIRFKPTSVGLKKTYIEIKIDTNTIYYSLSGTATIKPGPLEAINIDMGSIIVQDTKDSVVTAFIRNIDDAPVTINDIVLSGQDNSQFAVLNFSQPMTIAANSVQDIEFRFQPTSAGQKTAQINIYGDRDTITQSITGLAIDKQSLLSALSIDMGDVIVSSTKDSVVSAYIRNLSQFDIEIDSMRLTGGNAGEFSILSGLPPYTLTSNATMDATFRFSPATKGVKSATIEIYGADTVFYRSIRGTGIRAVDDTASCDETYFTFLDFGDVSRLHLNGKANKYNNYLRLTSSVNHLTGSAWWHQQVPVKNGFTTEFRFKFSEGSNDNAADNSLPGADGIAFVIQNSSPEALGTYGGGIGYNQIPNSLAIEFDTYSNDENQIENFFDPNGNHIAVQSNGKNPNSSFHKDAYTLGMADSVLDIRPNNTTYYVKIDYNIEPLTLRIYIDKTGDFLAPALTVSNLEINRLLDLLYSEGAYVGFTSATGSARENHEILSWTFCPKPSNGQLTEAEEPAEESAAITGAYPNPFSDILNISVNAQATDDVELSVFDLLGNRIATLGEGIALSGSNTYSWNATNMCAGNYYYVITVNGVRTVGQVQLIK